MSDVIVADIETYHGFFLVAFKRLKDGKRLKFELSHRSQIDRERLRNIIMENRIVTYNGNNYDMPLIWMAIDGATNEELKAASDRIINGNIKWWDIERAFGFRVPLTDHIDLIEPQPNAWASLKTLQGRLHGRRMRDLPIEPDATLSEADMDLLTEYCWNDLEATENLWNALQGAMALREALSEEYGQNFRSKSDTQMGSAILKSRVEQETGRKIAKPDLNKIVGTKFRYPLPAFLRFNNPDLQEIVDRLAETDFVVKHDGKVALPDWLDGKKIDIGTTTYAIGIGGLHSTEEAQSVVNGDGYEIEDADCVSYYPTIIINSGLYPLTVGPLFLQVLRRIKEERVAAKAAGNKNTAEGLKIAMNGGAFGNLGNPYSPFYAPNLLITVTLTGQLSLLMLVDRAESAGIRVVSANTDGVVFYYREDQKSLLRDIQRQWERDTGFDLEFTPYTGLYSASVNSYFAVKPDGKVKRKGPFANPRGEGDIRGQLMKNPNMAVVYDAVAEFLANGTPLEQTIRSRRDIRDFVTVVNVQGGGIWSMTPKMGVTKPHTFYDYTFDPGGKTYVMGPSEPEYLGKVVRYYWATEGAPIYYKKPDPRTGNHKKVSKTDGCRPLMDLPDDDALPADLDWQRYIDAAEGVLMDIGFVERPAEIKPVRFFKKYYPLWFAVMV